MCVLSVKRKGPLNGRNEIENAIERGLAMVEKCDFRVLKFTGKVLPLDNFPHLMRPFRFHLIENSMVKRVPLDPKVHCNRWHVSPTFLEALAS